MNSIISLLLLLSSLQACSAYLHSPGCTSRYLSVANTHSSSASIKGVGASNIDGDADSSFEKWSNPKYNARDLNDEYMKLGKALLTVGGKGVAPSHMSSLVNLLSEHEYVRVKLASDRLDAHLISKQFIENEQVTLSAELLEIRKRGLMFGSKKGKKYFIEKDKASKAAERKASGISRDERIKKNQLEIQ